MNRLEFIAVSGATALLSSCSTSSLDYAQRDEGLPCRNPNPPLECLQARWPTVDENVARGPQPDYPEEFWENQLRDADRNQRPPKPD